MCGILTYYNNKGISGENLKEALSSLSSARHRGPDGEGVVLINTKTGYSALLKTDDTPSDIPFALRVEDYVDFSADLFLGHRRLSIFDVSSKGFQPMKDKFGNWIVFNGAIYNYPEIRKELMIKGYGFNTGTDTEVILAAYKEWGQKCPGYFNGMWSFIIWDNLKRELFISNDRVGVKPLYYLQNNEELIFCSEQKQLLQFNKRVKDYRYDNIKIFLESGILDFDSTTFFSNVFRFRPSCFSKFNPQEFFSDKNSINLTEIPYYNFPEGIRYYKDEREAFLIFNELFRNSVQLRLRADVPWGITVSGGVDSSAIVYAADELLRKQGIRERINSFSAVFPGQEGDESSFIQFIEKDLHLNSSFVNPVKEFSMEDFEDHIFHQEVPIQSTSYYAEWCVARLAKKNGVKILLNGQGGDELFAGYHHHYYRLCREYILSGKILQYLTLVKDYSRLKGKPVNEIHGIVLRDVFLAIKLKLGLSKLDKGLVKRWNDASTLLQLLKIDFSEQMLPTYLRSDDRDGMAFGIESRHPFLDYRLVEFGFTLPQRFKIKNGWQKYILRSALSMIPDEIRLRKDKKGYTTPQESWIKQYQKQFDSYLNEIHLPSEFKVTGYDKFRTFALGGWLKKYKIDG